MIAKRLSLIVAMVLVLPLVFTDQTSVQAKAAAAPPPGAKGGLILYTVPPRTVCVGDTFTIEGGAFVALPDTPPPAGYSVDPLAGISVIVVDITTSLGTAAPNRKVEIGEDTYFSFSYTARAEGEETVRATLDDGLAFDQLKFKVVKSCTYDVFLTSVLDFTADVGDMTVHTLTNVVGMGTMKRVRAEENVLQGDGKWNLEENMLSQPPECVQWYMPPLIVDGPFDLDAELFSEDDTVNVILAFKPRTGPPVYHGKSICVDKDGNEGEGWGIIQSGGDESLAAKIQTEFPTGGGSQQVELTGAGMQMVQSMGELIYTANLTLISR